jgi:hypothetical protein
VAVYNKPEEHTYLDAEITDRHHLRLMRNLLAHFHLKPGDRVAEIGAGSGRYTKLLVDAGLKVIAIEPDKVLANKLAQQFANSDRVQVINGFPDDLSYYPDDIKAVCGFNVLHHIRGQELERLYEFLDTLMVSRPGMHSWFFLEPNPYSPLWLLAVMFMHGQTFAEERGIWQRHPSRFRSATQFRAACGWLPPRPWVAWFGGLADLATELKPRRVFWKTYQVIGAARAGVD